MIKEEKVKEFIDELKEEFCDCKNISSKFKICSTCERINKKAKEKFGELIDNHSPQEVPTGNLENSKKFLSHFSPEDKEPSTRVGGFDNQNGI